MIRIGTSGWVYPEWRGVFYPDGLPHTQELSYLAERMSSIELNATFYALQRPSSFRSWNEKTPDGFQFAVKGSRFITHVKRLQSPGNSLARFFDSGLLSLGSKLGPILWQFPPSLSFDAELMSTFLESLPLNVSAAKSLIKRELAHNPPQDPESNANVPIRYAIEVRHRSFLEPASLDLLRKHDIALVIADTAQTWPYSEELTADFVYIRLHGSQKLYESNYTADELDAWAQKILDWQKKRNVSDVYLYFDNSMDAHAPHNAIDLAKRVIGIPNQEGL